MPNFISEDHIEQATIDLFVNQLGYRHLNCMDRDLTGRESEQEMVVKPLLRQQLIKLNPALPESAINEAVATLSQTRMDMGELAANKEFYGLIRNGIQVEITNDKGRKEPVTVRVMDFDHPENNDFLVVSQLWVKGQYIRRRPDLIVYVNGLPLVFIELKNSNVGIRNAYEDNLTNYRHDIPLLFHYNAICVLSNGLETKIGSFNAGYEHFYNWLRVDSEKESPNKQRIQQYAVSLDYAVLGICKKDHLLDYVENFIFYYNDAIKITAKNHQFLGVNNAFEHFRQRLQHDREGTEIENKGKLGVFWHTQGSGKSYSMVFFTRKVFRKLEGNFTFLIVTDREDLDGQIYRNFLGAGAFTKDAKCRPADSQELRAMLQTNTRYIFTLIQKFRYEKGKQYPLLSDRNDIVVIVDEAHRTQYKSLAENMRAGLPNAQYLAFTGTPLLGSKKLTEDWFGSNISEYNFKQSIEDGATVPLFYHKRVPEVLLQNNEIDEDLADIVSDENLTEQQQERLEREFAQEISVLKADDRLETIARDIVYHFPRRGYLGKGMVVTFDKFTAVRMYDKVHRLWEEEKRNMQREISECTDAAQKEELKRNLDWMRRLDMAVVVSEEAGEEEKFRNAGLDIITHRRRMQGVDERGQDLETKFKNADDPLGLVFVCSMWLTGFDAPTVSTLYMDKPMKDHTLMQTIARSNRVTDHQMFGKTKTSGLVVDYYNIFRNLKKAFASYGGGEIGGGEGPETPVKDFDQLYATLQDAISDCVQFSANHGVDLMQIHDSAELFSSLTLFDEFADRLLANDDIKREFIIYDNLIDSLYEACKPDILRLRQQYRMKEIIHYLRDVMDGKADRGNLDSAKRRISQLLDESIVTEGQLSGEVSIAADGTDRAAGNYTIQPRREIDLSKLNIEKLREEFKEAPLKNIEISDLRAFISSKLNQLMERNITRTSFAQKLQEIIDRYNAGGNGNENTFEDLVAFVEQLREEEQRAAREGLSEAELEIFDLLKKENLTKDEFQRVKLASRNLLKRLTEEKPKVLIQDWYKDSQTRLIVQSEIKKILDRFLPESYDRPTYSEKCDKIYDHVLSRSVMGNLWVM